MNKKSKKPYHLLYYVVGCSPKMKKFNTINGLNTFIKEFKKTYPHQEQGDNWVDFYVTNITGEIVGLDTANGDIHEQYGV